MISFFKKIFNFIKNNKELSLSVLIVSVSIGLMVTRYIGSIKRLFTSVVDLGTAIAFYLVFVFERLIERFWGSAPHVDTNINQLPNVDLQRYVSFDLEELKRKLLTMNEALFEASIVGEYNYFLLDLLYRLSFSTLLLLPCVFILFYVFKSKVLQKNDLPDGEESVFYRRFCIFLEKVVNPVKTWIKKFCSYFWNAKPFRYIFCTSWTVSLNVATIIVNVIGYYFYFVSSFDVLSLGPQLLKLLVDLIIMFWGAPFIFWLAVGIAVFIYFVKKKGYKELDHMEAKNCGFLKTTDYLVLIKGPPGAGKTTVATDMALSWVNIHKADALEIMMLMEMYFPAFKFQKLRRAVSAAIESREINNIPRVDIFLDKLFKDNDTPYGYNAKIFAMSRNIGTTCVTLSEAVRAYAKAFFIYYNDNSVMANYSIRFDGNFDDSKHFKKWNGDFFKRNARTAKKKSRYARILNQDILRMGKKVGKDKRYWGSFGYGIYVNTEWGKSRGNKVTTEDQKKSDSKANSKNDLYSYALKMCRHVCSTIWFKVFFRFIGDEQRPESLSADQRELCTIIEIVNKSELKLAIPFAKTLETVYKKVYEPFCKFYVDYINVRSDIILSVMLYKFAVSIFSVFYNYVYNTFGYYELDLAIEKGSEYGEPGKSEPKIHKYYLMVKKIYSDRYNTDCHSAYFTKQQLSAELGMIDYPTYAGGKMSSEEMEAQNDYFINEMMGIMNDADNRSEGEYNASEANIEESISSTDTGMMFFSRRK